MRDETVMQLKIGSLRYVFRRDNWGHVTVFVIEDGREQPVLDRSSLERALADILSDVVGEEVEVHYIK
jgi:hypothetical protein